MMAIQIGGRNSHHRASVQSEETENLRSVSELPQQPHPLHHHRQQRQSPPSNIEEFHSANSAALPVDDPRRRRNHQHHPRNAGGLAPMPLEPSPGRRTGGESYIDERDSVAAASVVATVGGGGARGGDSQLHRDEKGDYAAAARQAGRPRSPQRPSSGGSNKEQYRHHHHRRNGNTDHRAPAGGGKGSRGVSPSTAAKRPPPVCENVTDPYTTGDLREIVNELEGRRARREAQSRREYSSYPSRYSDISSNTSRTPLSPRIPRGKHGRHASDASAATGRTTPAAGPWAIGHTPSSRGSSRASQSTTKSTVPLSERKTSSNWPPQAGGLHKDAGVPVRELSRISEEHWNNEDFEAHHHARHERKKNKSSSEMYQQPDRHHRYREQPKATGNAPKSAIAQSPHFGQAPSSRPSPPHRSDKSGGHNHARSVTAPSQSPFDDDNYHHNGIHSPPILIASPPATTRTAIRPAPPPGGSSPASYNVATGHGHAPGAMIMAARALNDEGGEQHAGGGATAAAVGGYYYAMVGDLVPMGGMAVGSRGAEENGEAKQGGDLSVLTSEFWQRVLCCVPDD